MALSNYDIAILPDFAEKAIAGLQDLWKKAKTQSEKDAIHKQAEDIRAQYNYSGGVDGSKFIALVKDTVVSGVKKAVEVVTGGGSGSGSGTSTSAGAIAGSTQSGNTGDTSTLTGATEILNPTTTTGNPFVQSLPDSDSSAIIPDEIKKVVLYGGIFVGGIMVLKILMGGKHK